MRSGHMFADRTALPRYHSRSCSRRTTWGKEILAPPVDLLPLLRWAQGPLSIPYRPGTTCASTKLKQRSRAYVLALSCVPRHQVHNCPVQRGSGGAVCPTAPDPTSLLRRGPVLPRIPPLRTLPLCSGGVQCCHVSRGSGPYLTAWEGSWAAMHPTTLDPACPLERTLVPPRVLQLPNRTINKEKPRHNGRAVRLTHYWDMPAWYRDTCKMCEQMALSWPTTQAGRGL
jgi:hypothetical protein